MLYDPQLKLVIGVFIALLLAPDSQISICPHKGYFRD
jgi:hypothetical protein